MLTRRRMLAHLAGMTAAGLAACTPVRYRTGAWPFTLGVASGEPLADGVVLWTRLAPEPTRGGGMPAEPVAVAWQIATDPAMRDVVRQGEAVALPELGHAVHVEVAGLQPDRWYWYRFAAGAEESPVGRTRTAARPETPVARLRLALASCQHYAQGWFTAHRHIAADAPDLVLFVGDYIYEVPSWADSVRVQPDAEPVDLAAYRNHFGLYKSDPDLQAAHAAAPWIVTWDDHEVSNDYAADLSQKRDPRDWFLRRRAAAYQAYFEHMPLRALARPQGSGMALYRGFRLGDLIDLSVLDNRQFRSPQPCAPVERAGGNLVLDCDGRRDAAQTMLGAEQERWLEARLARSTARWTVIAQQQLVAQFRQRRDGQPAFWTDGWDGYPAARGRLLRALAAHRPSNPVLLGGDIHSWWVNDLKVDFDDPAAPVVATEFVGTSVTSRGVPYDSFRALLPDNPHVRFFESRLRGYTRCDVTPETWRTDLVAVDARQPGAGATVRASFEIESGRPGARQIRAGV